MTAVDTVTGELAGPECRADGCDRTGSAIERLCVRHRIVYMAESLRDDQDLADVIAELQNVKVRTPEQRAKRKRDTWLAMVGRSVEDLDRYGAHAREAGATPEQISQAIGGAQIAIAERQSEVIVAAFRAAIADVNLTATFRDSVIAKFTELLRGAS